MPRSVRVRLLGLSCVLTCLATVVLSPSDDAFGSPSVRPPRLAPTAAELAISSSAGSNAADSSSAEKRTPTGSVRVQPLSRRLSRASGATPPTTAQCEASLGLACYGPAQLQRAYHLTSLYQRGLTGTGSTIVIVDPFGSPTALADLKQFDSDYGLPDPPTFTIIQPAGPVPAFDRNDAEQVGWAEETSLDLQWSHAMAPGANILLVETPISETEGEQGFSEIVQAENYVVDHNLGDVISQSFGATENAFPSAQAVLNLRSAFVNAAAHGVTVLAASGDAGATDYQADGVSLYPYRVNSWPSSDPLVTSVGGTQLHLDAAGNRTAADTVWNDTAKLGGLAAGGGGVSSIFARPGYQWAVAASVGRHRGTPDVSMSAAVDGGVNVYFGFTGVDVTSTGYYILGGTSEAAPELAGVVAIARQRGNHRLGLLNPSLYLLAQRRAAGLPDVTAGNNSATFDQSGATYTVTGYNAGSGFDLASGLGTVNAEALTAELTRGRFSAGRTRTATAARSAATRDAVSSRR